MPSASPAKGRIVDLFELPGPLFRDALDARYGLNIGREDERHLRRDGRFSSRCGRIARAEIDRRARLEA